MACAPKCGRRAFVDSGKYRVETAQAAKACRERNLGHGQVGIVDQALGALNPCRLGDLGGRGADMLLEQAQQVSRANAEPLGKRFDARLVERTFVDETHRPLNGGERAFPGGREGRRLGPAAQARSIPCGLSRSGGWVVFDILAVCVAHRADRPAVDAGRANAREKAAVIGRVAADPSAVAFLEIEH